MATALGVNVLPHVASLIARGLLARRERTKKPLNILICENLIGSDKYLRELVAEPDIIETDYPSEFIGLPWSRDAIHALQEAAMRRHRTNLK